MFHSLIVWILWSLESIILGTIATFCGIIDSTGRTTHLCARLWARLVVRSSGIKVKVTGLENLTKDKPYIFISNHQGYFDIFSITAYFPIQLRWIAKKSLFSIPFVGWAMRGARYISIDRDNKRSAIKSVEKAAELLGKGYSVVIFPEGTRSLDGELLPFKRGSLILMNRATAPVVPVTIYGSHKIIQKNDFRIHKGTIQIKIDKPIYTESMSKEEKEALLENIRERIQNNLKELKESE